jgi:hypothetical protein
MEPKYTKQGMPVIENVTLDQFVQSYSGNEQWGIYLTEVKQRILKENPVLARYFEMQVGQFPEQMHDDIFGVLVGMYGLLERQSFLNRK